MAKKKQQLFSAEIERINPSFTEGLTTEQVNLRKEHGLSNTIIKKTGKSYLSISLSRPATNLSAIAPAFWIAPDFSISQRV